jgi:hypothetical protein
LQLAFLRLIVFTSRAPVRQQAFLIALHPLLDQQFSARFIAQYKPCDKPLLRPKDRLYSTSVFTFSSFQPFCLSVVDEEVRRPNPLAQKARYLCTLSKHFGQFFPVFS